MEDDNKVAGFIKEGLEEEGYAVDRASDEEIGTICRMQTYLTRLIK